MGTISTGADLPDQELDEYQKRYLVHQQHGKKDELVALMRKRHSYRIYDDRPVEQELVESVINSTALAPSSCDRHGVRVKIVTDRDSKALLNGLLVGGVGWIYRAPVVLMLFADRAAYKGGDNGDEINYNALLDAGVMLQQMQLMATANGLHSAFCNPQVRKENRDFFYERFAPKKWKDSLFCGAIAIGYPPKDFKVKKRNPIKSMIVE